MASDLMSEFSLTATEMGNFAASFFYAYMIMQIPVGLIIDRFGPRFVTSLAIILCVFGVFLFATAESFFIACIGRFVAGIGGAFAVVNYLRLAANWFSVKRFAFLSGLMMTAGMIGSVFGQAPLSALIAAFSWRGAMKILSISGLILAVLFVLIVRDRAPHHREVELNPEKLSLGKNFKKILCQPQSWLLTFYSGFAFAPFSVFGGLWGVSFLKAQGFSPGNAAQGASLMFLGFAVGAPFFGWLSDHLG